MMCRWRSQSQRVEELFWWRKNNLVLFRRIQGFSLRRVWRGTGRRRGSCTRRRRRRRVYERGVREVGIDSEYVL